MKNLDLGEVKQVYFTENLFSLFLGSNYEKKNLEVQINPGVEFWQMVLLKLLPNIMAYCIYKWQMIMLEWPWIV